MAESIRNVMSSDPIALAQGSSVQQAAQAMRDAEIGDVIVIDDSEQPFGIVTDRDIAIRLAAEGRDPADTRLGEICRKQLETLTPDASVGDAVRVMTDKAIRRLPVVEDGRLVGIVSLGDLAVAQDPKSGLADISAAPPNN